MSRRHSWGCLASSKYFGQPPFLLGRPLSEAKINLATLLKKKKEEKETLLSMFEIYKRIYKRIFSPTNE